MNCKYEYIVYHIKMTFRLGLPTDYKSASPRSSSSFSPLTMPLLQVTILALLTITPPISAQSQPSISYPPCPVPGQDKYIVQNWIDTPQNLSFDLTSTFDPAPLHCSAPKDKDNLIYWEPASCTLKTGSPLPTPYYVNFTYYGFPPPRELTLIQELPPCTRSDASELYSKTTSAHITAKINATAQNEAGLTTFPVPVLDVGTTLGVPDPKCRSSSETHDVKWVVSGLRYLARITLHSQEPFWGSIPYTNVRADFRIRNVALGYKVYCWADYTYPAELDLNNETLIEPGVTYYCEGGEEGDSQSVYPVTSFRFDKARREINLVQRWKCEGEDGEV